MEEIEDTTADKGGAVCGGDRIWKACAGSLVRIPAENTTVYYFPAGHLEQPPASISSATSLSSEVTSKPYIPCRVLRVSLLADKETDEVFARFRLQPIACSSNFVLEHSRKFVEEIDGEEVEDNGGFNGGGGNDVVSFAKGLTPSDANNGGGFSVPKFCADSIFPPLDFEADPPVQTIRVRDVHGKIFEFRHIYRGTPRRHLLTTGWSKFVNSKKLVAGDSAVFIRNKSTAELFVGVRREIKKPAVVNEGAYSRWGPPQGYFRDSSGSRKGKAAVEKVVEAAGRAVRGEVFEVEYYPRPGLPEFVVAAERVERALSVYWNEGLRVKMPMETEDSSRVQWFQGTVVSAKVADTGVFHGSIWRMLEVKWDEHEILKNMNKVSPWQVQLIPPTPSIHAATYPLTKKVKYSTNNGLYDGEDKFPLPSAEFGSMMGQLNPSYLNPNPFSAGMQGARHNQLLLSSLTNTSINTDGTPQTQPEYHDNSMSRRAEYVPIDLNVGKTPSNTPSPDSQNSMSRRAEYVPIDLNVGETPSNTPSPDSQNSVQLCSPTGTQNASVSSIQLFGQTIRAEPPPSNVDDNLSCNESDDGGAEGAEEIVVHALADSYQELHDKVDAR